MTQQEELAWVAGIFEGEGCISFAQNRPRVQIRMCDKDVLERVHARLGGYLTGPYHYTYRKTPIYVWSAGPLREVERILNLLMPYLGQRRKAKATEALDNLKANPPRHIKARKAVA